MQYGRITGVSEDAFAKHSDRHIRGSFILLDDGATRLNAMSVHLYQTRRRHTPDDILYTQGHANSVAIFLTVYFHGVHIYA